MFVWIGSISPEVGCGRYRKFASGGNGDVDLNILSFIIMGFQKHPVPPRILPGLVSGVLWMLLTVWKLLAPASFRRANQLISSSLWKMATDQAYPVRTGLGSDYVVRSAVKVAPLTKGTWVLTPFDWIQAKLNVGFVLVYDYVVDQDRLVRALTNTLQQFPPFLGFFDEQGYIQFDPAKPVVELTVESMFEDLPPADSGLILGLLPQIPLHLSLDRFAGEKVTAARIVYVKGTKTCLCLNFNHALGDMSDFTRFLEVLNSNFKSSDLPNALPIKCFKHNAKFLRGEVEEFVNFESKGVKAAPGTGFVIHTLLETIPKAIMRAKENCTGKVFHFDKRFLDMLKQRCLSELRGADSGYLSTNDVLSALIWKAMAHSVHDSKFSCSSESFPYTFVINGKGKIPEIDFNYVGNFLSYVSIDLSVRQLRTKTIAEIARQIRRSIISYSKDQWKNTINFLKKEYTSQGVERLYQEVQVPGLMKGVFCTNWSTFDVFNCDFGVKRADDFHFILESCSTASVGTCVVLPFREGKDLGLTCKLFHHTSVMNRLENVMRDLRAEVSINC